MPEFPRKRYPAEAANDESPEALNRVRRDDEERPVLGPGDKSDTGSDTVQEGSEEDTLPLPPRTNGAEDENADPVGHGDTEPDGSPLPPPSPMPPWRRGAR